MVQKLLGSKKIRGEGLSLSKSQVHKSLESAFDPYSDIAQHMLFADKSAVGLVRSCLGVEILERYQVWFQAWFRNQEQIRGEGLSGRFQQRLRISQRDRHQTHHSTRFLHKSAVRTRRRPTVMEIQYRPMRGNKVLCMGNSMENCFQGLPPPESCRTHMVS